jgi:hypothetical protein
LLEIRRIETFLKPGMDAVQNLSGIVSPILTVKQPHSNTEVLAKKFNVEFDFIADGGQTPPQPGRGASHPYRAENVIDEISIEGSEPFTISMESCYGMGGNFKCNSIRVANFHA